MKIGFCFLCKNDIHQLDMWLKFLENNYDKSNIYIHSYEKEKITQDFVRKYQIDQNIPTDWEAATWRETYSVRKLCRFTVITS